MGQMHKAQSLLLRKWRSRLFPFCGLVFSFLLVFYHLVLHSYHLVLHRYHLVQNMRQERKNLLFSLRSQQSKLKGVRCRGT